MMSSLRISGVVDDSIVDGKGLRYTIFTQGCPHHCPGCHNPQTHSFDDGTLVDTSSLFSEICENPMLRGVTFSGGEPFCQPKPLAELAKAVHDYPHRKLDVTVFTGYTLEQLQQKNDPDINALLEQTDILIDGPFIESEKDLTLLFRGSRNQRIIDMKQTRETGHIVLADFDTD